MVQVALGPDAAGEKVRTSAMDSTWNHFQYVGWVELIVCVSVYLYVLYPLMSAAILLLTFN